MRGGSLLRPGVPESQVSITLSGREYPVTRARLGTFIYLQQARRQVLEASAHGNGSGAVADALYLWFHLAAGVERVDFETASWLEVGVAYGRVDALNAIIEDFPILKEGNSGRPPRWDYAGREIVAWVDMIAHAYGWTPDEIVNLYPEDAVGLWQEIVAREYSERRFVHALSQVAYRVDGRGRATYVPLDTPYWMVMGGKPRTTKIPKDVLPIGNIVFPRDAPAELVH